tara:strand:- start:464 stop:1432 length:969 start_codon:yes stop_codon:yes gene_type:complete
MSKKSKSLLSDNAVKVRLTTRHYSGIKSDKFLRSELAETKNAREDYLNVQKHLLGKDSSKYFRRVINKFRNDIFYPMTVAWSDNSNDSWTGKVVSGWRLVPVTKLDQLMDHVEKAKVQFEKEVEAFLKRYPYLIESAKVKLGDAFEICDYLDVEDVREKFLFDFEMEAVTEYESTKDIRLNCSENLKKKIENDARQRVQNNVKGVMKDVVSSLLDQVDHLVGKLSSYDPENKQKGGFFKDSSFENLKKTLDSLPSINNDILGGDADIKLAHQKLVAVVTKLGDVSELREKDSKAKTKRNKVAKDLANSIDDLKGSFLDKAMK